MYTTHFLDTSLPRDAGYELDWSRIAGNKNDEASRLAAEEMDLSKLITMFNKITSGMAIPGK